MNESEDLKRFDEPLLAKRVINYVDRIRDLMSRVDSYMQNGGAQHIAIKIRDDYRSIKEDIKNDAHYVNLSRNTNRDYMLYNAFFRPSIAEASAWGMTVPTNCSIDFKLYSSLSEAAYRLTKYHSYKDWEKISGQQEG